MGKIRLTDRPKFAYRNEESDSEEYILYHRCSLMVEKYIKMHVHNIEDVYNLRQEVLLKVLEGLDKSYYEQGHFFQWVMTIAVNMVNDYYRRKKNAPVLVALEDNVAQVFVSEKTFSLNPQLHSRSATYKRNGLLIRKTAIKSSRPFQCAYYPLTP